MGSRVVPDSKFNNPFKYTTPITRYEMLKMSILCLLGIPLLRLILLVIIIITCSILCFIATIGYYSVDPITKIRSPLPEGWRTCIKNLVRYLLRGILFCLGYHWIHVKLPPGGIDLDHLPRVILANHVTYVDGIFCLYYMAPSVAMKAELSTMPLVKYIFEVMMPIYIDRSSAQGRKQAVAHIETHLATQHYPPLMVFPEGTTSNQAYLTKFKVGSFSSGVACQPVVLKYPFKYFDVSWTHEISLVYLVLRSICQVYNRLEVEFLPVFIPSSEEVSCPQLYGENVRQVMAKALGAHCTNHAFEDVALLMDVQIGSYVEAHLLPITSAADILGLTAINTNDLQRFVLQYMKRDLNHDGWISRDEFTAIFPHDESFVLDRLFTVIDADKNGQIDFQEFCVSLAALNDQEELVRFAFCFYDMDGDGVLNRAEVVEMIRSVKSYYGFTGQGSELPHDVEDEMNVHEQTYSTFNALMNKHPTFLQSVRVKLATLRGPFEIQSGRNNNGSGGPHNSELRKQTLEFQK